MKLNELLNCLPIHTVNSNDNPEISSIEMDSREVKKGSLFICIKGFTVDGYEYAMQAINNGAVAILSEKALHVNVPVIIVNDTTRAMAVIADYFYSHPTQKLKLIGVTGTNGKTTITHILDQIFNYANYKTGLIGTMYTKIGDEKFETKNTTPESLILQKTFSEMVASGVTTAFMEVSSHALDLGRVRGCEYDVAIFTNLTQDHLDYHKTMNEYRNAKGLLFSQLGNSFQEGKLKYAVLNEDDEASAYYKKITAAHVITYGIQKQSDFMATNIKMTNSGTTFLLQSQLGNVEIKMKLIGKFSVLNVLAAIAAASTANIPLATIKKAVEDIAGVAGRFELVDVGQSFPVIVDYAHTPDSLENVLQAVNQFAHGKIYVIVGCGGDRDKTKRPLMAKIAVNNSDEAIFTSDNPRSEDPKEILKDMEQGVENQSYVSIVDRKDAIAYAINKATGNDVILIAGKGHETYQEMNGMRVHFDDREVARTLLRERLK